MGYDVDSLYEDDGVDGDWGYTSEDQGVLEDPDFTEGESYNPDEEWGFAEEDQGYSEEGVEVYDYNDAQGEIIN